MAAQKQQKYLIQNISRVAPPASGPDTRTMRQKVGHAVQFRDKNDSVRVIPAGGRPLLVDEITPGMLALASEDVNGEVHIKIKPIDDVMEALKEHALPAREAAVRPSALASGETAPMENPPVPEERQARAVEMGKDVHAQRGGSEHEGAVNPSGDPNFLVRAPAGPQHGRRGKREAAVTAG